MRLRAPFRRKIVLRKSVGLADQSLDPIAFHSVPAAPTDGDTDARLKRFTDRGVHGEGPDFRARTRIHHPSKRTSTCESLFAAKREALAHRSCSIR